MDRAPDDQQVRPPFVDQRRDRVEARGTRALDRCQRVRHLRDRVAYRDTDAPRSEVEREDRRLACPCRLAHGSCVPDIAGQPRVVDAVETHRRGKASFGRRVEQHVRIRGNREPCVLRDSPRATGDQPAYPNEMITSLGPSPRATASRTSFDVVSPTSSSIARSTASCRAPMEHEATVDLDGTAEMDRRAAELVGQRTSICSNSEESVISVGLLTTMPSAPSHCARRHRCEFAKARIGHRRHGDQEVMREIGGRPPVGHP